MTNAPQPAGSPLLTVEHLTMRFGGLVAVDDLSFSARAQVDVTAIIGPERGRQDHGVQLPHRLLQARRSGGSPCITRTTASRCCWSGWKGFRHLGPAGRHVARTFQNIRLVPAHVACWRTWWLRSTTRCLMSSASLRPHRGRPLGCRRPDLELRVVLGVRLVQQPPPSATLARRLAIDKAKFWIDRIGLTDRADWEAGNLPYGDAAAARDRARHVHRPGTCSASTSRRPGFNPREIVRRSQRADSARYPR